jgi:protein-L-isoaspartate(D-aspartate) O-methyltransferase
MPFTHVFKSFVLVMLVVCVHVHSIAAQSKQELEKARGELVKLVAEAVKDQRVLTVIGKTERHKFVQPADIREAYYDIALPIGHSATISPPGIVGFMTEQLHPQPTDKVLEIGTGSGYQAAILSPLVSEVYSIEIIEPLGKQAEERLKRLGYKNVHCKVGDGYQGWAEHAPFDKIIVTCSPENIPVPLAEQLKEGGKMVIPLGERYQQSLCLVTKENGELKKEVLESTFFIPMR